jgi:diguanylate cyclase (GGDEF)-like protein
MNTTNLAILVVDDTKFSSAIVSKTLANAGYDDIRSAKSALEALELIKERPIDILLADWMMPEMDGLELTQNIRKLDEVSGLYTYTILLTAKDGNDNFARAFDAGVDDFINKASMKEQLVPRIMAATRLVLRQNKLLRKNRELTVAKHKLEIINTVDPLTKIGNQKYAEFRISDTLSFVESRGGALCYLHFAIVGFSEIKNTHRKAVAEQLLVSVSKRIQQLVRPMDGITRVGQSEFGVIQHQSGLDICQGKIFKRIMDGVNIKAYETEAGFISVKIAMSLIGIDNKVERSPTPSSVIAQARKHLNASHAGIEVDTYHWSYDHQD